MRRETFRNGVPPEEGRGPVFIVGCSRSGTTLLQSILSQHEDFVAFPETNVFNKVLEDVDVRRFGRRIPKRRRLFRVLRGRVLNSLGLTAAFDWDALPACKRRLESMLGHNAVSGLTGRRWSIRRIFKEIEDAIEQISNEKRWIEKSPQNLWCLHLLVRYFRTATFIHIVREGTANVASLVDAGRKYDAFRARFGGPDGIDKAVRFYNSSLKVSSRYEGRRGHIFVRYEDLSDDTRHTLEPVGQVLGVTIRDSMLSYRTDGIVSKNEVWKMGSSEIRKRDSKFDELFSDSEKEYVRNEVLDADYFFPRRLGG